MDSSVSHTTGRVAEIKQLAEQTFFFALETQETLPAVKAGQFAMLRLPNTTDPLLGRPFAVYRAEKHRLEVVFITVGKMTTQLAALSAGDAVEVWLPLGNGFPESEVQHTIMVAGGIGQTAFFMLAEQSASCKQTLLYGARSKSRIACIDDFRVTGIDVFIATDDGSEGKYGLATDLIETVYRPQETTRILACGPQAMLKAVFRIAKKLELPCFVSLETAMSCGMGICCGCVVQYKEDPDSAEWDYKRTCKEGPVFDAYKLNF